jgi:uroporphyrinogen decarboxylase
MREPDPDFERLKKTLYGHKTDRVPLAEITIDEEAKEKFLGKPVQEFSTDIEFYIKAGYDYITLGRRLAGYAPVWDRATLETYYEVQRQVGHGKTTGIITSWNDFKNYPWMKTTDLDFRIFDLAEKTLPKEMKVVRYMGPVFQMVWMLMGFDAFSYKLIDEPGLIEAMMDKIFKIVLAELDDALSRDIVGAVWYGDDIALKDRLFVSPEFLRRSFFPRLKIIGDACKRKGIPFMYHTDGDVSEVIDDIINAGVTTLHPIDPLGMDIYQFKNNVGNKLSVVGNIDIDLLMRGQPEEIVTDVKEHIDRLAPMGGYIMGSGNSIPRNVKIENYRAMLETTLNYGVVN